RDTPRRGRRAGVAALAAVALCSVGLFAAPPGRTAGDGLLRVIFLDVGQGDAALVRFPGGETMLVDAGGRPRFDAPLGFDEGAPLYAERFDVGERVVCEALWTLGVGRLDYVVASHGDVDHVGGFAAVLARMRVGRALLAAGPDPHEAALRAELA